jgi:uncharacterized lipoprotein YmbA
VTVLPQAVGADTDYRAAIEVQRFESALGQPATLGAVWRLSRARDGSRRTAARPSASPRRSPATMLWPLLTAAPSGG